MDTQIDIYFAKADARLDTDLFNDYMSYLPQFIQDKIGRYIRWQNQQQCLLGNSLLRYGLKKYGYADTCLNDLQYNEYGKPYLKGEVDFNISHSSKYVVCALANKTAIGIDIEEIKSTDLDNYKISMTEDQWRIIYASLSPYHTFFQYWTIKESVIKAEGKGMSIPLDEVHINKNHVNYANNKWYLHPISIDPDYSCTLATQSESLNIKLVEIDVAKRCKHLM